MYLEIFLTCDAAIKNSVLIERVSAKDKEFHFQNWFEALLTKAAINFDPRGRNTYPDYTMVKKPEGYELKGLAYPGREANYDCNSQVPSGQHNGRSIYYVFGRYPKDDPAKTYPVLDLVVCNGDFLNATHDYVHKNKNVKGFGSYAEGGTGSVQVLAEHQAVSLLEPPLLLELQGTHRRESREVLVKARRSHPERARQALDPQRLVVVMPKPLCHQLNRRQERGQAQRGSPVLAFSRRGQCLPRT